MCGCDLSFVCSRCRGTRDDWRYWHDEPKTPAEEADEQRTRHTDAVVLPGLKA